MKKFVVPSLFVLVLVVPFLLRLGMGVTSTAAAEVGSEKLIIITSHAEGIRREFADAFRAYHKAKFGKDVAFDYIPYGSEDLLRTLRDKNELYSTEHPTLDIDLAWGGGDYLFDQQLKKERILQPVQIDPAVMAAAFPTPALNGLPLYDVKSPEPYWIGTALSGFGVQPRRTAVFALARPTNMGRSGRPPLQQLGDRRRSDAQHVGQAGVHGDRRESDGGSQSPGRE